MKPQLATFEEVAPFLKRIDQSNIYSNHGPLVCELEESYSKYLGVDHELVVAVANATQAIQGLVSISINSDWIVPDYTFSATGLALLNSGKKVHLCDVSLLDWKVDVSLIKAHHKTFGIIPVMPFGSAIDFEPYQDFEEVIIDAAASLGSSPPNFKEMQKGWAVVYSLHATKVLGAGEGAIVVCGNPGMANKLRAWINFGFLEGRSSELAGTNAKMPEVSAAYGLFSILNVNLERRDWLSSQKLVTERGRESEWCTYVNATPQFQPYWIAQFENEEVRKSIAERLNCSGIQSREWWAHPLSEQKAFSKTEIISPTRNSGYLAKVHLGLPMYRGLSSDVVNKICDVIEEEV
jgi:dTDP-4-amino-4,6-dideoxygalactose transaminase